MHFIFAVSRLVYAFKLLLTSDTSECVEFFLRLIIGDLHRYMNVDRINNYCRIIAVIAPCYFLFSLPIRSCICTK